MSINYSELTEIENDSKSFDGFKTILGIDKNEEKNNDYYYYLGKFKDSGLETDTEKMNNNNTQFYDKYIKDENIKFYLFRKSMTIDTLYYFENGCFYTGTKPPEININLFEIDNGILKQVQNLDLSLEKQYLFALGKSDTDLTGQSIYFNLPYIPNGINYEMSSLYHIFNNSSDLNPEASKIVFNNIKVKANEIKNGGKRKNKTNKKRKNKKNKKRKKSNKKKRNI